MKRIMISLLILAIFAFPAPVLADVAPPYFPPGYNLQPDVESTQVRMAAEMVLIDVQDEIDPESLGRARITADFTMHNTGSADESMSVRFPISASDGRGDYPEISDIQIKTGGRPVTFRRVKFPDQQYPYGEIPWAEFDARFPAGIDTSIQVSYTLKGTGYPPYTAFYYVLETGAGWKDTIGSADIILRLPYAANPQNVVLGMQIGWAETTRGSVFQGNEARWHFENFEPGPDGPVSNMEFALVAPGAWHAILSERNRVNQNPKDGEAWGRLGRDYKQIFLMNRGYREDPGGEELYQSSIEAYEKCLALKPEDAQWHAGFADLLASHSYWDTWMKGPSSETIRGLNEIRTALELAPKDPRVLEIAENIYYLFPDGMTQTAGEYDFPWLTRTPTSLPPTPTIKPAFDAATISGTYQSKTVTLSNKKKARLTAMLNPDHSATWEIGYENEPEAILPGRWMDNGDGTLVMKVTDPNRGEVRFVFRVDGDRLKAVEYPGLYEGGIEVVKQLDKSAAATATVTIKPAATTTPEPTAREASSTDAPAKPTGPGLPICGAVGLIPLAGIIGATNSRVRRRRDTSVR